MITANPDGLCNRTVVSCNGTWPWPDIRVKTGDRVVIHLINGLDQNTSLHFHGLFQTKSNQFDGVPMVTQCEIAPNDTMIYNFTVPDQVGTYWYHSHSNGQYMDGMKGGFIIEEKTHDDYPFDFDEDVTVRISEWYHKTSTELQKTFLNLNNPTGAEPIPQTLLLNDTLNGTVNVLPGKTYLFRFVNTGGFLSQYVFFEDHSMTVVAIDGIYVEPNETDYLYITVAQRYDVLVETKNDTSKNYALMLLMDPSLLDVNTTVVDLNWTSPVIYNSSAPMPTEYVVTDDIWTEYLDDFYLQPLTKEELYEDYDYQINIAVIMDNLINGINYAFFNNVTYTAPKVPTLGTVLSAGNYSTNDVIYGTNTNTFVLSKDEVVEIVLNNNDTGKHPFHLHGHVFQAIERGPDQTNADGPINYNESAPYDPPAYPMRRDTFYTLPQSYFRIRFKANNPGVWFYHCHIEWHLVQGLAIVLVEDPTGIQSEQSVTDNWKKVCEGVNVPYEGNAAANTENYLDITGQNVQKATIPGGMTARGIVALVFSCISAFVGMFAICWYGMADIPNLNEDVFVSLDVNEDDDATETKEATEGSSDELKSSDKEAVKSSD